MTLDPTLLPTLTSLHVTPAPTGTATLTMPGGAATLNFPITGGNVTIYNKGAVTPYVQGIIHHDGSGFASPPAARRSRSRTSTSTRASRC